MSREKDDLDLYLTGMGFEREVPFRGRSGKRRWRWDYARDCVAVEYHGIGVGHQSVRGTWRDHEKTTEGQLCGWIVVQCNVESVRDGRCYEWIDEALASESGCSNAGYCMI